MTYSAASPFHAHQPRITPERFETEMQRVGSPWADRALYWYGLIVAGGHDPAVWLAIGLREHRLLTDPNAVALKLNTNSWTNARSVRIEGMDHDIVTTLDLRKAGIINRQGPYVRYRSIAESLQDGMRRIDDPAYVYHRRFGAEPSIGQVLSLWTESEAVQYTGYVVGKLNEWNEVDNVPPTTYPKPAMTPYPSPNHDGYSVPRKIEAIANHIGTATKASNLAWLTNPASKASCNAYIAKDGEIFELVPIDGAPWTNGVIKKPDMSNPIIKRWSDSGLNPNPYCYTIEHEGEPEDELTEAQIASNNEVTAWVASVADIPIDRTHIIGHYQIDSVNRGRCPSFSNTEWSRLIDGALALLQGTYDARIINGYLVTGAILTAYEQLEQDGEHWWTFGLPIEHEETEVPVDGILRTVQRFDRCGFVMTEGGGAVIAKPGQQRQIEVALGINDERAVRLDRILDAAKTILDEVKVLAE